MRTLLWIFLWVPYVMGALLWIFLLTQLRKRRGTKSQ